MSTLRVLPDPDLRAAFAALYPHVPTQDLAKAAGITLAQAYRLATSLGLKKSDTYLASPHACRLRRGDGVGKASRFQPGHTTWNKGMKGLDIGGKETRFKPGVRHGLAAKLYQPIGTERISKEGYLQRKVNDDLPLQRRWRAVHVILWEETHGPVPPKHHVSFKDGDKRNIVISNLELVSFAEMCRRNSVHRLPPEIKEVTMLRGQIRATITKRNKKEARHDQPGQ